MNSSWINSENDVCVLYKNMLLEVMDIMQRSGNSRLHRDIVSLLKNQIKDLYNTTDVFHNNFVANGFGLKVPKVKCHFSLSTKDYDDLENVISAYEKSISVALDDFYTNTASVGNLPKIDRARHDVIKCKELFFELLKSMEVARNNFETDSKRYIEHFGSIPLITIDDSPISVILDDYTIDTGIIDEQTTFDRSLEKLGNYVLSLLDVGGKKPISKIVCRINMKDANVILSTFGNSCDRGVLLHACKVIKNLCKDYSTSESNDVIVKINDSVSKAKSSCRFDCDSLKKINAISYFKSKHSVVGFFDPSFPDIIFVRECDYASGAGTKELSEAEINDLHTAVHEYLHYCSHGLYQSGLINYSSSVDHYAATGFNEGLTEYLAILCMDEVLNARKNIEGHSYPDQVAVVTELVKLLGQEFMIRCYTTGGFDRLGSAVNELIADSFEPDPWKIISSNMSTLQKVKSGYGVNTDGTPYTWRQRERIVKECRDNMLMILKKRRRK